MDPSAKQEALARLLPVGMFGQVLWVGECGSTNTVLADEARGSFANPHLSADTAVVLVTDRQTAGRGRLGRVWEAPVGSALTMSVRVPMPGSASDRYMAQIAGLIPLVAGLAARSTVLALGAAPNRVELKWPNDLMDPATGRKLGGILCEAIPVGGQLDRHVVIVGVGINLSRPGHSDGVVAERAQWVDQIGGSHLDSVTAAATLARAIVEWVSGLETDPANVLRVLRSTCATIGRQVRVEQHERVMVGTAIGIGDDGSLIVQPDGSASTESVHAGDVIHLR